MSRVTAFKGKCIWPLPPPPPPSALKILTHSPPACISMFCNPLLEGKRWCLPMQRMQFTLLKTAQSFFAKFHVTSAVSPAFTAGYVFRVGVNSIDGVCVGVDVICVPSIYHPPVWTWRWLCLGSEGCPSTQQAQHQQCTVVSICRTRVVKLKMFSESACLSVHWDLKAWQQLKYTPPPAPSLLKSTLHL